MSGSGLGKDFRLPPGFVPASERKRVARLCLECKTREFGKPDWECERHPGRTITQRNRPYFGQSTEDGAAEKPVDV